MTMLYILSVFGDCFSADEDIAAQGEAHTYIVSMHLGRPVLYVEPRCTEYPKMSSLSRWASAVQAGGMSIIHSPKIRTDLS